ncbi:helix-turn-helix transcriptional regulator [Dyadobacter sandarakinus]|uniref:Helix-turn-helix transcriptional regulator n=1 Tax=Dyadobacter sandarakinus TaxID=2747268 RepID=A0ABX7IDN7_9BACT|nr:helix-turn-helix transcriptional regulator [Dyadobacter sandarakinus]QRR03552.1 helix-turn-helix transcriptional regulator [Dyadobacter sandarakinus]
MPKQKYNRIKIVLAEKEKSAKWLAEVTGKDKSTVSRWCTNDMQPTIETFYEIAKLLDVEVRELLVPSKQY